MHDFTVVDFLWVTSGSSSIGGPVRLEIKSAHSGRIEGSISNIIVSIDSRIFMLKQHIKFTTMALKQLAECCLQVYSLNIYLYVLVLR